MSSRSLIGTATEESARYFCSSDERSRWRASRNRRRRCRNSRTACEAELSRRRRKIKKRGRAIPELAPRRRHKLRIAAKKLRYAAEFFTKLYSGGAAKKRRKALLGTLKSLQQALGDLNDIAAERALGSDIALKANRKAKGGEAFAAGLLVGHDEARVDNLLEEAAQGHAEFSACKPFWK